ncbi:PREDICTED: multifunctional methyltransferase subunit TRM112-like protein [Diuraphis noxia]|uniref:multifunctional methyltransferase subunit TRM112-like protein n=1 Tax=Diuraphis noxia TaxID=143948 RepID=UPI0007637EAB|nr:PREDICTED: multifunctional methyltransferase subunit TRM112-like protein [Diuraphis noxia]
MLKVVESYCCLIFRKALGIVLFFDILAKLHIYIVCAIYFFGQAKDVKISESEFNKEFVKKIIPKLDWKVFVNAAVQIGHSNDLSDELIDDYEDDEEYLKKVHHVLMEVSVGRH